MSTFLSFEDIANLNKKSQTYLLCQFQKINTVEQKYLQKHDVALSLSMNQDKFHSDFMLIE